MGRMGVPESAVDSGHAFHTYTLTSPDGSGELAESPPACRACLFRLLAASRLLPARKAVGIAGIAARGSPTA